LQQQQLDFLTLHVSSPDMPLAVNHKTNRKSFAILQIQRGEKTA